VAKNKRMHTTAKEKRSRFFVGTIEADQIRKIEQASRGKRILALVTRSGQGAHGVDKCAKHRLDRRDGRKQVRNWQSN